MVIHLGHSVQHASNVLLVMNTKTQLVSPQFHVVYDGHFMTMQSLVTNVLPSNWKNLFQDHAVNVQLDNPILRDSALNGMIT
jgi:hypothetical protein